MGRIDHIGADQVRVPDLGGDEQLVSINTRVADALSHVLLVVVHASRIKMTVANLDSIYDGLLASSSFEFVGT